jgi:hypothetical protein
MTISRLIGQVADLGLDLHLETPSCLLHGLCTFCQCPITYLAREQLISHLDCRCVLGINRDPAYDHAPLEITRRTKTPRYFQLWLATPIPALSARRKLL